MYANFLFMKTIKIMKYDAISYLSNVDWSFFLCFWLSLVTKCFFFSYIFYTIGINVWKCIFVILKMHFRHFENAFSSFWKCIFVILKMHFRHFENAFSSFWKCIFVILKMHFRHFENAFSSFSKCIFVIFKMHFRHF